MSEQYDWKEVYFEPWVGNNYKTGWDGTGKKLLVVGESHYASKYEILAQKNDKSDFTITFVEDNIQKPDNNEHKFFQKVTSMLWDEGYNKEDAWHQIAFCNYVQHLINKDSGNLRPSNEMHKAEANKKALIEIILQLKPSVLICFGKINWNYFPANGYRGIMYEQTDQDGYAGNYKIGDVNVKSFALYHPSYRFFNFNETKKIITENIKLS